MNRYMVIDFERNEILNLAKIDTNFKENEEQTSSTTCIDKLDLLNTLKDEFMELVDNYDYRVCSHCGKIISAGFVVNGGEAYYCNKDCLHKYMTDEEFLELYDNGLGDSYWTTWGNEQ